MAELNPGQAPAFANTNDPNTFNLDELVKAMLAESKNPLDQATREAGPGKAGGLFEALAPTTDSVAPASRFDPGLESILNEDQAQGQDPSAALLEFVKGLRLNQSLGR